MAIAMYVVYGLFLDTIDLAYLPQFEQFLSVVVVFLICSNFATMISRFRNGHATLARAAFEGLVWLPFLTVFFSGLSLHICTALLAYLVGYNMQWSATEKEVTQSTIWRELPLIFKRFWPTFLIFVPFCAAVGIMATPLVPLEWRIEGLYIQFSALWLACGHVLYPFLLNPFVIRLSY